jgi:hypothetical protein
MGESRDFFHRTFIPAVEIFVGEGMAMAEALRIDTVCEMLRSVRLRSLVRYWDEKRGDRSMPARREIDPTEIPRLLPIALIADSPPAGPRIRLLGSETTNAYGREIAGQLIEDVEFGEFTPSWRDAFARVRRSEGPASASGMFRTSTETCNVAAGRSRDLAQSYFRRACDPAGRPRRSAFRWNARLHIRIAGDPKHQCANIRSVWPRSSR